MSRTISDISQLGILIWIIRLIMLFFFVFFSWIPLVTVINYVLPQYFPDNFTFFLLTVLFTLGLTSIAIIGILSLRIELRDFITIIYTSGVIFSFGDPFFLSFGVVSSWLFYEIWYVARQFKLLDQEYSTYPESNLEKYYLIVNFRNQVIAFLLQAWITLSISWVILYIASNYYFELGDEFGTLGIATSFTMLTVVYLTQRNVFPRRRKRKIAS
ncbi:MAG: hypothetical protein ACXAB2_02590 [Candidatus Hodarchaeales archaeon]